MERMARCHARLYRKIDGQRVIRSMGVFEGFLFGAAGGILGEVLNLFKLRHQPANTLPDWIRSCWYWAITTLMVMSGGFLVVVYLRSNIPLVPIVALNLGASAPLIIGTLVAQAPAIPPGRSD